MSSGLESYKAVAPPPNFAVNKVDVFSSPGVTGGLPMRGIAIALTAVLVAGGGYLGFTKVQEAYDASKAPVANSSVPPAVREQAVFIKKVDNLCAASFAQVAALATPTELSEFGPWATQLVAINKDLYADITTLKAPKRDRKLLNRILAGFRAEIRLVEHELIPTVAAGNVAGLQPLLVKGSKLAKRNSGLALSYGFTECGAPRSLG